MGYISIMIDMTIRSASQTHEATDITNLLKVLADENRLKIITCLSSGEKCVCQLADALDIPQNLISHHLKVLKTNRLVSDERRGRWVYYSLKDKRLSDFVARAGEFCGCDDMNCP